MSCCSFEYIVTASCCIVGIGQVIGCKDCIRNELNCVRWGIGELCYRAEMSSRESCTFTNSFLLSTLYTLPP